jgi:hypothetical protein
MSSMPPSSTQSADQGNLVTPNLWITSRCRQTAASTLAAVTSRWFPALRVKRDWREVRVSDATWQRWADYRLRRSTLGRTEEGGAVGVEHADVVRGAADLNEVGHDLANDRDEFETVA